MMAPGLTEYPEHTVTTEKMRQRVGVFVGGEQIAETRNAIRLLETDYEPRIYIPREHIWGIELIKFDDYDCPFKGRGELYHIKHGYRLFENGAWSYLRPYDNVKEIKGLVAFYPNKVQLIRVTG